jgi:hypothetical protein
MLGAVPVSFFFFFIIAVAAALEINTLEGEIRLAIAGYNTGTALSDAALILAVMILPVPLVLWIYRLLYSMFGLIVVYYQGRRLTRIEKEQPDVITVSDNHIAYETPSAPLDMQELSPEIQSKIQTIPWAQLSTVGFDDYYLFGKIIRLLSRTILVPDSGKQSIEVRAENQPLILEGITTGYWDLQTEISDHVKQSQPQARVMPIKFDFLDLRWFAGIVVASTLIAFYLVSTGQVSCEPYVNTARNLQVYNCIGPFLMNLLPTIALALPAVILWRLLFHSYTVERSFQLRHTTFPTWLRWLSTIFCTLILILWLLIILGQSASPPPA